ncbi:hypothetical protein NE237_006156 [Protea cynaroides]|uniref:Uncharacterized protein n=1 Tax=Protea cynaroides TaxID=273540 RepID=A0A9Q0KLU7_9MAGN|nr:hypothetical protein NE237_006156 [Protea cynaroides]
MENESKGRGRRSDGGADGDGDRGGGRGVLLQYLREYIHEVERYFGKRKMIEGEGATKKKGEIWKPSFQFEDFEEMNVNNIKGREKRFDEAVADNHLVPVVLDLNAEPEPEPEPEQDLEQI